MFAPFITPTTSVNHPKIWKKFSCGQARKALLTVTGLGLYRAFLNGKRVGMDYLTPGFNDYDACLRTQTYDVTGMLEKENCLEVWLGNGWYKGRLGFDGGKDTSPLRTPPTTCWITRTPERSWKRTSLRSSVS